MSVPLPGAVATCALRERMTSAARARGSWVKLGAEGAGAALKAGANDLGGSLMNESISRAAGTEHGQEMPPARLRAIAAAAGRPAAQRTTLYGQPPDERIAEAETPVALSDPRNPPAGPRARANGGRETGRRSRPPGPVATGRGR